jgi:hypothetical protein
MVQLFVTVALTLRLAVAVAADAGALKAAKTRATAAAAPAIPRNMFALISYLSLYRWRSSPSDSLNHLDGTRWYSMSLHGRGQVMAMMATTLYLIAFARLNSYQTEKVNLRVCAISEQARRVFVDVSPIFCQ